MRLSVDLEGRFIGYKCILDSSMNSPCKVHDAYCMAQGCKNEISQGKSTTFFFFYSNSKGATQLKNLGSLGTSQISPFQRPCGKQE